jgi:hypothetical protein
MGVSDFPPDCIQSFIQPWWTPSTSGTPERGRLLWAFVPIIGLTPRQLVPARTGAPEQHDKATFVLEPVRASQKPPHGLPVAALPAFEGEVNAVYRAKRRPVVVIGTGPVIDPKSFGGSKGWQTDPVLIVAPYFGVDTNGARGGWNPEFVRRIRHAEYPGYLFDQLPPENKTVSVLRLDQIQPIGRHHDSYQKTDWRLSDDALTLLDEQLRWLTTGKLDGDGLLDFARGELPRLDPAGVEPTKT